MRYLFGFVSVCALGMVPLLVGCGDTGGTTGQVFPCTEQGIRNAIADGGGPHTFDCHGPTTVVTEAEIVIDNDVVLDGEGNLTVDGSGIERVLSVKGEVVAEIRGFTVTGGAKCGVLNSGTLTVAQSRVSANAGAGVCNSQLIWYDGGTTIIDSVISGNAGRGIASGSGSVSLQSSTVSENSGGGISNYVAGVTIRDSTVSRNSAARGGGIYSEAHDVIFSSAPAMRQKSPYDASVLIVNSTISQNSADEGGAIFSAFELSTVRMFNATVAQNSTVQGADIRSDSPVRAANTLIDGDCLIDSAIEPQSSGGNIESPGDSCFFSDVTDQVSVTPEELNLGPLQDSGGPTMTHALLPGSIAIDRMPEEACVDGYGEPLTKPLTTDQRGEPRPETGGTMCDVGAFEVQP
jgi:predicted outer membrane repeat protein